MLLCACFLFSFWSIFLSCYFGANFGANIIVISSAPYFFFFMSFLAEAFRFSMEQSCFIRIKWARRIASVALARLLFLLVKVQPGILSRGRCQEWGWERAFSWPLPEHERGEKGKKKSSGKRDGGGLSGEESHQWRKEKLKNIYERMKEGRNEGVVCERRGLREVKKEKASLAEFETDKRKQCTYARAGPCAFRSSRRLRRYLVELREKEALCVFSTPKALSLPVPSLFALESYCTLRLFLFLFFFFFSTHNNEIRRKTKKQNIKGVCILSVKESRLFSWSVIFLPSLFLLFFSFLNLSLLDLLCSAIVLKCSCLMRSLSYCHHLNDAFAFFL